jgi:hypothetical protein
VGARRELLNGIGFLGDCLAERAFVHAGHVHLADFFLERHAPQQILDSLFDGSRTVAIESLPGWSLRRY